ncbi:MAG: YraN family protein [Roseiarcus sp.]|jgi:putative endonuclease
MAPRGSQGSRRRAHVFGLRAEWIAAAWLLMKGYRILARRFSAAGGEVDLIARRGLTVAFVEVKARPELDEAATAIGEIKRRRLSRAARVWLTRNPWAVRATLRGDAVFVAPGRLPRHAPAAYLLDLD